MSIALDPIQIEDVYTIPGAIQNFSDQYVVNIPIPPDNVAAIKVYNSSPFTLKLTQLPGIGQVWQGPFNEEVYQVPKGTTEFVVNQNVNQFQFSAFNLYTYGVELNDQDINTKWWVAVTVYQVGDVVPLSIPITHAHAVHIIGEVNRKTATLNANSTFAGGAPASLNIAATDTTLASGIIIPYYTILAGISFDVTNNATQHNFNMTINGVIPATSITININIPVGSFSWYRTPMVRSAFAGQAGPNQITVNIPAIGSGPGYSLWIWGYGERTT